MEVSFSDYYRLLFETLLETDATTGIEAKIACIIRKHHKSQNYSVKLQEIEKNRFNIWAFHPSKRQDDRALFSSHIDTVPPHLAWTHHPEKDLYHGRGACDTKGGIVSMLIANDNLNKSKIPIDFLWVVGEEVDHIGAKNAIPFYKENFSNFQYKMLVLCEPTNAQLAIAQKGIIKAKISFAGKNAHSAYPHLGRDANKRMIEFSKFLYDLADSLRDDIYGSFDLNIGLIKGGDAANVISSQSEITLLARTNTNHTIFKNKLSDFLSEHEKIKWITNNGTQNFPHSENLNYKNTSVAKFNTDASYLANIAPVYLMGPGNIIHAHSDNEHIFVSEIMEGAKLYRQLVLDLMK